jgi:hypothetical protein
MSAQLWFEHQIKGLKHSQSQHPERLATEKAIRV